MIKIKEFEGDVDTNLLNSIDSFINYTRNPEFQIAFVGTIKTGKSTLINALLGKEYASMAVTPETAALTKFRSSKEDYVRVKFYSKEEWQKLWKSISTDADTFLEEYKRLNAEKEADKWIGHKPYIRMLKNNEITDELAVWSSSKRAEHYFVKEIEVGISTLGDDFPKQVVFVDTPGLSDPVAYRSNITRRYIEKANAVFVCVDAKRLEKEEIDTIASVFSYLHNEKEKLYVIATHWDVLNNPLDDWKNNKEFFVSTLTGKAFYKTANIANANITYSSAFIYNKCLEYQKTGNKEVVTQLIPLITKTFPFEKLMDIISEPDNYIEEIKQYTNISNILRLINTELISKHPQMIMAEINRQYDNIMFEIRRIANDGIENTEKIITAAESDLEQNLKMVENENSKLEYLKKEEMHLRQSIEAIKKSGDNHLRMIKSVLDNKN